MQANFHLHRVSQKCGFALTSPWKKERERNSMVSRDVISVTILHVSIWEHSDEFAIVYIRVNWTKNYVLYRNHSTTGIWYHSLKSLTIQLLEAESLRSRQLRIYTRFSEHFM
jgi:hypothetical protein